MRSNALCAGLAGWGIIMASFNVSAAVRHHEGIGFYIGYDGLATVASSTYAGLSNPNADRLTLLLDHGEHFHGIGAYSYTGPASAPDVMPTNTNNRIPETYSLESPLPLGAGSGLYSGTLRSHAGSSEYSHLGIASIQSLAGHASESMEDILFQSSNNRWSGQLDNVQLGLRLVQSTPGLRVGSETTTDIYSTGDVFNLGMGNSFEFKPVYWVDAAAPEGIYSATFQLLNTGVGSPIGDSGTFHFDFAVSPVPEPETYAMLVAGLFMVTAIARRRRGSQLASH
ncbi:MAG: PEP-CTERM sorting domain-containing protein [Nitrosospira sp.]|nr:PEP-CTERM sorting domain-containing protein [Nitrosospira sp.]